MLLANMILLSSNVLSLDPSAVLAKIKVHVLITEILQNFPLMIF